MNDVTIIAANGAVTTRAMTTEEAADLAARVPTAADLLAAERAGMVLTRLQFARQATLAGVMTAAEARAWAGAGTDTAMGTAALLLVPEGTARDQASIVFAGATTIDRNNALMPALQTVAGLTDEQVDEFFRAGMLL